MTEQLERPGPTPRAWQRVRLDAVPDVRLPADPDPGSAPPAGNALAAAGNATAAPPTLMEPDPPGEREALIVCIGTTPDQNSRVLQSVGGDALVVVAADTRSVVHLLDGVRRAPQETVPRQPALSRGRLHIDRGTREVLWDGRQIALSARGFELLCVLASEEGRVWSFAELTARVWRREYLGDDDSVTSAVKRLRARISAVTRDVTVVSVRGVGYRLAVRG